MLAKRLMIEAARRMAQNPEVRRIASEAAEAAYRKAAPKVGNAGRHVAETFRETSADGSPLADPVGFAKRFRQRLMPPES